MCLSECCYLHTVGIGMISLCVGITNLQCLSQDEVLFTSWMADQPVNTQSLLERVSMDSGWFHGMLYVIKSCNTLYFMTLQLLHSMFVLCLPHSESVQVTPGNPLLVILSLPLYPYYFICTIFSFCTEYSHTYPPTTTSRKHVCSARPCPAYTQYHAERLAFGKCVESLLVV